MDDIYDMYNWEIYGCPGEFLYGDDVYIDEYYMDERWKPIDGEGRYWISNKERVFSTNTNRFIKPKPMDKQGHLGVSLSYNGKPVYRYLHRLMAEAFIPNPGDYPIVRHLNDVPDYNEIENLAWGTHKDNHKDCVNNGHYKPFTDEAREKGFEKVRRPVRCVNLDTRRSYKF